MMARTVEPSRIAGLGSAGPGLLQRRARDARYTTVAIVLHWLIALMIIFNLSIGYFMEGFTQPFRGLVLILHLSAGMTVLALTVLRVIWRLLHEPPAYPPEMKSWERHAAHFAHFLLYAGMVLMPLTGWAILSAHPAPGTPGAAAFAAAMQHRPPPPGAPTQAAAAPGAIAGGSARPAPPPPPKIWFVIPMPAITPIQMIGAQPGGLPAQDRLHKDFVAWHSLGGWLMIALLSLHVVGALKHQLLDRQDELQRMGVGRRRHPA